ncbi:MAG: SPOR domain-containing protein [Nitrosomonas sp.]|nr:SPOR domain-containing protein [Nitrosomonas sp.]
MKIIFIFLLMVNIAVAVIIQHSPEATKVSEAPFLVDPEKIVLLPKHVHCLKWGDFQDKDFVQAKKAIPEQKITNLLSAELKHDSTMYWVHIPPLKDKESANREINKLRNLGIASFREESEGKWMNAIYFSMFDDIVAAQKLLRELRAKGASTAVIKERNILLKKIIIYEPDENVEFKLKKIAEQYPGSTLEESACERI